jgi:putative SOS response-associated peptidase YedK
LSAWSLKNDEGSQILLENSTMRSVEPTQIACDLTGRISLLHLRQSVEVDRGTTRSHISSSMCGRFTLRNPRRIRSDGGRSLHPAWSTPRYNIAPGQEVAAITAAPGGLALSEFVWGLIPSWSKERKGFINARAETLEEKPSFGESFQNRRCLIPADGFYEWKRNGKAKQPYYFQRQDEAPFAFAGLWDVWQHQDETISSCAIITTTPNELLAEIHDRMPVILSPAAQDAWLHEHIRPEELKTLLVPFPAAAMKSFPVSQQVNHAQVDEASLVEPVELRAEPLNLTLF